VVYNLNQIKCLNTDWTPCRNNFLWIGGRNIHGVWAWDGLLLKNIVVADWALHQPDNYGGNQNCLGMCGDNTNFQWNDDMCSKAALFMCEKHYF